MLSIPVSEVAVREDCTTFQLTFGGKITPLPFASGGENMEEKKLKTGGAPAPRSRIL
jgi:hypothetical protein